MNQEFIKTILHATGANTVELVEVIQKLWSGYGIIGRYRLSGTKRQHVVVKHVQFPKSTNHPRGWNTNLSHERKLKSYQVEQAWYQSWAEQCNADCKVPDCLAVERIGEEVFMVLEDLDESGFPERLIHVSETEMCTCLRWLANFHATFLHQKPIGLWDQGTYWHLDTRPDELKALTDKPLKKAAVAIDQKLKNSPYQTFLHGDAKLANFCFSVSGKDVAAVDFQYVGGGCGMKDVAYFIGSCLNEEECENNENWLLDYYFKELNKYINKYYLSIDGDAVEADWRALFPVAWADFHRFLKGWSPEHWKINAYSERMTRSVIENL